MSAQKLMWTEIYRPRRGAEVVGNEDARAKFTEWLKTWKPGARAALLYGPPGVGKTTLVGAAAAEFGFDLIEMNASDTRTEEALLRVAGRASRETSLSTLLEGSRGALILLDEVDGIYGREDQGGLGAVVRLVKETKTPLVLVANDVSDLRFRDLRDISLPIKFYQVRPPIMMGLLRSIALKNGVEVREETLRDIAENSRGDVRSALNDLQTLVEGGARGAGGLMRRDRGLDLNQTLKGIFLADSPWEAKQAQYRSQIEPKMLHLAVHDNLPLQYTRPEDLASAYEVLSQADIFFGRINRTQNWGLLSYAMEGLTVGVASRRKGRYPPAPYRFPPQKLMVLSRSRGERELRGKVCEALGGRCHVSKARANIDILPYVRIIFEHDGERASHLAGWLGLGSEERAFLGGGALVEEKKPPTPRKKPPTRSKRKG